MHHLNSYFNLTTSLIVSGLMTLTLNPAEAATWSRTLRPNNDTYSDTNNPNDNSIGGSQFIQVGNLDGGFGSGDEQQAYLSWNVQELLQDIPVGSEVRNLSATLIMTQSGIDPGNPNDPNRRFNTVPRVTLDGLEVTGDWNEGTAIDPGNPPSTIQSPTLFSGQIDQGTNRYAGIGLNRLITDVLNSNLDGNRGNDRDVLSIALRGNNSLNFPAFGVFPIDSFFSKDQDNIDLEPRLELDFDVWTEAHRVTNGSNFAFYGRAGGDSNVFDNNSNGDWELSLGTKSVGNPSDSFVDQNDSDRQLTWDDGVNLPFELTCDADNNNLVTLTVNNDSSRTTSFNANSCQDIDGLKIFAVARQQNGKVGAGTNMRIRVTQVREVGGTIQNVNGFSALSIAGQINDDTGVERVEDFLYFLDSREQGGLGFTNGIDLMRGDLRMAWRNSSSNPQGGQNPQRENVGSRVQAQLIPLIRINDPSASPVAEVQGSLPQEAQPAPAPSCSVLVPDELWSALTAEGSGFTVDDSICSEGFTPSQTVPEPNSILSFILLGTTGLGIKFLKKRV